MRAEKISMAVSTFTRMGTGMVIFILLARFLGPAPFGLIATATAYSTLLALISDYGLATYTLREAGAHRDTAARIVRLSLVAKMLTTLAAAVIGAGALLVMMPSPEVVLVSVVVFVGVMAASFADQAFVIVRALGRFDVEARNVVVTSAVSLVVLAGVAIVTHEVVASALAFMGTRLFYLGASLWRLRSWFDQQGERFRRDEIISILRSASSYALDGMMTNLSNQIDVVMVSLMLDQTSIGIYQAGARLVQSISPFAVILSTVYLPKLSERHRVGDEASFHKTARSLILEFCGLAAVFFLGFLIVGPLWTVHVYGENYRPLIPLWPAFASFVFVRFVVAASSIQLIALGRIKDRLAITAIVIPINAGAIWVLLPRVGLSVVPTILSCSSLLPLYFFNWQLLREGHNRGMVAATLFLSTGVVAVASFLSL